ncbi:NAD(P)-dependent oxidoreductase [Sulfurimonas sp.]|jgi:nucleoside-diphosphate-sugar epimerase|uniref:NAD-dependent epimerase/dehydratase family protein n=1 Tax=Sulfurimonas sp. TaxID=2022749 RepID=UPI0025FCCDA3|nr:NAD(P)-dependent oxidoreductase [Sulfurimonas sp.]
MSGKKLLITGGTGYVGSALVNKLITQENIEIALVVRDVHKAKELFKDLVTYILYDDLVEFKSNIEEFSPEIVVHLAAYSTSSDEPKDVTKLIESNIIFTSNLLIALENCKVKLFVNTGSFSEHHHINNEFSPTYFYSATKTSARYMIEYYSKKNAFKFVNAILFTVYGKKNGSKKIIDYAMDSLGSVTPICMSDGKQILDFIHIDDIVEFCRNLIENFENLTISKIDYDVGTGDCISIRELVKYIENITNKKANISWGVNQSRKVDTIKACADVSSSQEELKYSAKVSIVDGLVRYIEERD